MGQSDDTDPATVRRADGTDPVASGRDRGNVMLAMALVLAALVVLAATSMVLAPTGSDGVTTQQVDQSDTDVVREGLSLVFVESRDTLNQSYDPVFTSPDSEDPLPINYTTVAALLDPYPFTDEQVVQTQYLMSSLAHRTIGGSIASLEPVADRTTTGMLVRLGTNDSQEFTEETVLAENVTGVQDLVFALERRSLPTSADTATTIEVGDWTVAAYQNQTTNRVRYQLGSYDPGGNWRKTKAYTNLRVNTYEGTVNGEAVDSLAVDPGGQEFTIQVVDDRRGDGDSASGSVNLVAAGAESGDVGNLPDDTWQEVVIRPAFNVTYIDATTTFVDRISVDTTYRAFEFATVGSSPGSGVVGLSVSFDDSPDAATLRDRGLLSGSGVGTQPLFVGEPRNFTVSITYTNGTTEALDEPREQGVSLELTGPEYRAGGASVPNDSEEFATLDGNGTVTPQAATGEWVNGTQSGPITLQASLDEGATTVMDTATAQAVNLSAQGVALWGGLFGSTNTTVYTDSSFGTDTLYTGLAYTARLGKPGLDWQNRTAVGVDPTDMDPVTNENTTAATLTLQADGTYTLDPETTTVEQETVAATNITERAGLNLSALGYAADSYDAQAAYAIDCYCNETGPVTPEDPHIATYPSASRSAGNAERWPQLAVGASPQNGSYYTDYNTVVDKPRDTVDRWHVEPQMTLISGNTASFFTWSNFQAALAAGADTEDLRRGDVGWRDTCPRRNLCIGSPMGWVDHFETVNTDWTSYTTKMTPGDVSLDLKQVSGGSGYHKHNLTATVDNDVNTNRSFSVSVTGSAKRVDKSAVNTETWKLTVTPGDEDGDDGNTGPGNLQLDSVTAPDSVAPNVIVSIDVSVTNTGTDMAQKPITLKADFLPGPIETGVTLSEGESTTETLDVQMPGSVGTYEVAITTPDDGPVTRTIIVTNGKIKP